MNACQLLLLLELLHPQNNKPFIPKLLQPQITQNKKGINNRQVPAKQIFKKNNHQNAEKKQSIQQPRSSKNRRTV